MSIDLPVAQSDKLPNVAGSVLIGPEEYVNGQVRRFARNKFTSRYFRLGRKEHFLLAHLDGTATADDILRDYADTFGRRLTLAALNTALKTMADGGLLAMPSEQPSVTAEAAENISVIAPMPSMLSFTLFSGNPDPLLKRIVPRLSMLVRGRVILVWAILIVIAQIALALHLSDVVRASLEAPRHTLIARIPILYAIIVVTAVFHEAGHVIACKAYGGQVREIGMMFKYLTFRAYSKLDDILLFKSRLNRCYVLMLGPLVSFSLIPVVLLVWLYGSPTGFARVVGADILIWYNVFSLTQFVPYLKLDGYFMLAQFLRMPDLMRDSYMFLFCKLVPRALTRRSMDISVDCPGYVRIVYVVYGLSSVLVTGWLMTYTIVGYSKRLSEWIGYHPAILVIGAILLGAGSRFAWRLWRWNSAAK